MNMEKHQIVADFIFAALKSTKHKTPLIIGMQGVQGSGKTTLSHQVVSTLHHRNSQIKAIAISLDDFYLTRAQHVEMWQQTGYRWIYKYRGLPGTHDLQLACDTLDQLCSSSTALGSFQLPAYDKSACGGEGDRVHCSSNNILLPVQVVIFEGWCLGFRHLHPDLIRAMQTTSEFLQKLELQDLLLINRNLRDIETRLYPYFDGFVRIDGPAPNPIVYEWRWQQELELKRKLGDPNAGLSFEKCREFIDRFMICYELYMPSSSSSSISTNNSSFIQMQQMCILRVDSERRLQSYSSTHHL